MKNLILCLMASLICANLQASDLKLISGSDQSKIELSELVKNIEPSSVIVMGESHAFKGYSKLDQLLQVKLIESLQEAGFKVSVGMEFISFTFQESLDAYLNSEIDEGQFLKNINWGKTPYENYKKQILSPLNNSGWTYGINAPRFLTKKIFRTGLGSLTPEERDLIPEDFEIGNDDYYERFVEAMGGHGDPQFLKQAFTAQSVWDDTMAWNTNEIMKENSSDVFVIIVGNFHVRYGGGLVDRLYKRGLNNIISIIQTPNLKLDDIDREELAKPHEKYGEISTYVW